MTDVKWKADSEALDRINDWRKKNGMKEDE